jgi:hypothetical protein
MRKVITTGVMAACLTVAMWTGDAHAKNVECRFGIGHRAVKRTIWCVSHKLNEPGSFRRTALYVAGRESGFYARAVNSSSGTCGVFQHQPHLWPGRFASYRAPKRFGRMAPSCFSGRTNVIVSLLMAKRGGWGPWAM